MAEMEKTAGQKLAEELLVSKKTAADRMSEEQLAKSDAFCEDYKKFLDAAKTEREAVDVTLQMLKGKGYVPFEAGKKYAPGEKIYYNNRGKALVFATIGTKPLNEGVKLLASHIDSPRIDLKPCPLYEDNELALLKTHYYGGIRKYQWGAMPLALHGVVVKRDGTSVTVKIGEEESDPVFCITDLLPHLSQEQNKRTLREGLKGEELNILIGSRGFKDDKASEKVKLNVAKILFDKFGMTEADFLSADLTLVPAHKARDLGFDRSMIGAYGHDDRVCAYTSIIAAVEATSPAYTHVTVLADKEETGSDSNTGLNSAYLKYFIEDLAAPYGIAGRTVLSHTECLSADVNVAFDPTFPEVTERRNTAYLNYGVVITKYTGSGGKSGTSEATAEFMGKVRSMLDENQVVWQTGELGRVDLGGGGTVAKFIAALDVDVVDLGVPVLSMHAPFEVVSKLDVYNTYLAFSVFLAQK